MNFVRLQHPIVDGDQIFLAPKADGGTTILLDSTASHTHAPGRNLTGFTWTDVATGHVVSKNLTIDCWYPFGTYTVSMQVRPRE